MGVGMGVLFHNNCSVWVRRFVAASSVLVQHPACRAQTCARDTLRLRDARNESNKLSVCHGQMWKWLGRG